MKKNIFILILFCLCLSMIFGASNNKMYVSVEEVVVKDKPSFFAKSQDFVYYGDAVLVIEEKGKWKKIQLIEEPAVFGWVSTSALTKKKIVKTGSRVSASAEELALAGKGFSEDVEMEYKKQGNFNYDAVDKLEENKIDVEKILDFMISGKLNTELLEEVKGDEE